MIAKVYKCRLNRLEIKETTEDVASPPGMKMSVTRRERVEVPCEFATMSPDVMLSHLRCEHAADVLERLSELKEVEL